MEFEIRFTFDTEEARQAFEFITGMMYGDWMLPRLDRLARSAVDDLNAGTPTSRKWVIGHLLAARVADEGGRGLED